MDTLAVLRTLLEDELNIEASEVEGHCTFEELGLDSLDYMELICAIEDCFDISFGDPQDLQTMDGLVAYIEGLL